MAEGAKLKCWAREIEGLIVSGGLTFKTGGWAFSVDGFERC